MRRIEQKKTVGEEPEMNRVVSWSELCSDLLGEIMGRLCFADLVRFQAVCMAWHNVYLSNKFHAICSSLKLKSTSISSWFVRVFRTNQGLITTLHFHVYAPSHSIEVPISVNSVSLSQLGVPVLSAWFNIRIICKYNWLFICVKNIKNSRCPETYFTLFSPLTKKIKQLPPCLDYLGCCIEYTFSSDPESADCIFLLLDTLSYNDKFVVATCRKDDQEWIVRQFGKDQIFLRCVCIPIFARGIFCIVSPHGQMVSYDVIENKMRFETLTVDDDLAKNHNEGKTCILFMVNGDLFYDFGNREDPCTKRYDWVNRDWISVSSLRDSAMVNKDKPHSVADVIDFYHSGCLICSLESFDLVRLMHNTPGFIFYSGSSYWARSDACFWLEPPLSETETMLTDQVNN